ncbi:MAG: diacylglycerol kinase [Firmicutes bacterium]|nr:diacylglycerol kinase [Bacillota bacterium]
MKYVSRDEIKQKGIKRFFRSIKFSVEGLIYAYRYEQSMWIHAIATIFTVALGVYFKIKLSEWAIVFIALGSILGMELVNTAIEAAVDLTTLEINPLAKIAKDCGSAASFVLTLVAIVICLFVFGPYFTEMF